MSELTILGPIEAWRWWSIRREQKSLRLAARNFENLYCWPIKEKAQARYPLTFENESGLHAYKDERSAVGDRQTRFGGVLGKVALWGEIIECESGYRAEFGYPLSLIGGCCVVCQKLIPLAKTSLYKLFSEEVYFVVCSSHRFSFGLLFSVPWWPDKYRGWYLSLTEQYGIKIEPLK